MINYLEYIHSINIGGQNNVTRINLIQNGDKYTGQLVNGKDLDTERQLQWQSV